MNLRGQRGTSTKKHVILFLAANPSGTDRLALDREARSIHAELKRSGNRDRFDFVTRWAAEPLDLLRELRELKPTVVHFSGHGGVSEAPGTTPSRDVVVVPAPSGDEPHGLNFHDAAGGAQVVSPEAIAQTFGAAGASVKLVVLNACFTEPIGEALLTHVDCVVGMRGSIHDAAARSFEIGFYGGLGEHESIAAAFKQGRAAIGLEGLRDEEQPQLKARDGIDTTQLVLAAYRSPAESSSGDALLSFDIDSLDSDLQDVVALAAAQARREGKIRISTRHIFAAFMRLRPGELSQLLNDIQSVAHKALPEPATMVAVPPRELLREPFFVSSCIQDSLTELLPKTTPERKLSSEDMFVDIAKYGTGPSVRQLRTHGISRERISAMVEDLGWNILERPT